MWKNILKLIKKNAFEQSIALNLVKIDKIVISDKFKHSDKGFKCLLAMQMIILLDLYALYCLRWVDT